MRTVTHRVLFAASVLSAALYAFFGPVPPTGGGEMIAIAQQLARSGVFGHPFVVTIDTGPTAVVPPVFPAWAGALIRFLGASAAWIVLAVGAIVVQALHVSLLPRLSRLLYGDRAPGVAAAVLCILLPVYCWMPYWDAMYTATGLMLFCLASERMWESETARHRPAAFCGLAAGSLALLNPSTLLVSTPWLLLLWQRKQISLPRALRFGGVYTAALLLVLLPWALRNQRRLHTLALRTNLGMTLFASNTDCATSSLRSEMASGCYAQHHPYGSVKEAERMQRMGEAAYDRDRVAAALVWVRAHPAYFASLTAQRTFEFWFPNPDAGLYGRCVGLVTLLSLPGLILTRRSPYAGFVWAVFLIYPGLYYVVVSDFRYRYPILWLSLLPAGYALSLALDRIRALIAARAAGTAPTPLNVP